MAFRSVSHVLVTALAAIECCKAASFERRAAEQTCRKTSVAILGAGVAGITAAQALSNASVTDFVIVEYNGEIGGRVQNANFGTKADGSPYVIELGSNWVQGLGSPGGPENPIWTFVKKWNVTNTVSNFTSIITYNETGAVDYTDLFAEIADAFGTTLQDAGHILTENLEDTSFRAGLSQAGWKPKRNMTKQAVEWWQLDWATSFPPDDSSLLFGNANYNLTFNQYSGEDNYVFDQRGFNAWIKGEASTYLTANDSRLLLNTIVTNITYSDSGVTVYNADGSCISADYAICTFSLGVLQNDAISFSPALPNWKQAAIDTFQFGSYTKIFLQFNTTFWDADSQYFLYADPHERGYYPIWQSLSTPGFLPGSNILFVTVVDQQSYRVEAQGSKQTQEEVMAVLRDMFPGVDVPDPVAFMYPRWSLEPWVYGGYSNWPVGASLERHQNLRANVDRLWFAGEATSAEYFGFLQGSWFEGREAGERIAGLLRNESCVQVYEGANLTGNGTLCGEQARYEVLHGTTPETDFNATNGWAVSSFQTLGLVSS